MSETSAGKPQPEAIPPAVLDHDGCLPCFAVITEGKKA
jgi:hypothetical protein